MICESRQIDFVDGVHHTLRDFDCGIIYVYPSHLRRCFFGPKQLGMCLS